MATVVIDAAALLEVFVGREPDPQLRRRTLVDGLTSPEQLDTEVLNVLRRLERAGKVSPQQAALVVDRFTDAPIVRATHRPLIGRIWELRHAASAYDASYLALAEQLDIPFVTCDAKLAGSHGHKAQIELYSTS